MSENLTIKPEALESLFAAWEEPEKHRVKRADGEGAEVRKGRRPSSIALSGLGTPFDDKPRAVLLLPLAILCQAFRP